MRHATAVAVFLAAVVAPGCKNSKTPGRKPLVLTGQIEVVMEMAGGLDSMFFLSRPYLRSDDGGVYFMWVRRGMTQFINLGPSANRRNGMVLPQGFVAETGATYRATGAVLPVDFGKLTLNGKECTAEEFSEELSNLSMRSAPGKTDHAERQIEKLRAQKMASELSGTHKGRPVRFLRVDSLERLGSEQ